MAAYFTESLKRIGKTGLLDRVVVLLFVVATAIYGGTKSTNGVPPRMNSPKRNIQPQPAFDEDDQRRGFVTFADEGETFDFTPPPHATTDRRWRLRGAQDDRRDIDGARIFTRGWMIRNGETNQILKTNLTIVPESRWPRIGNVTSCFWTAESPTSKIYTWQHVLADGDAVGNVAATNFHFGILHLRTGMPPQRIHLTVREREGGPCCTCPSHAAFVGFTWDSNVGIINGALNYHGNVVSAFNTAPELAMLVNGFDGEKVVMAHSLGNMVVSSAIQDHGMKRVSSEWVVACRRF